MPNRVTVWVAAGCLVKLPDGRRLSPTGGGRKFQCPPEGVDIAWSNYIQRRIDCGDLVTEAPDWVAEFVEKQAADKADQTAREADEAAKVADQAAKDAAKPKTAAKPAPPAATSAQQN